MCVRCVSLTWVYHKQSSVSWCRVEHAVCGWLFFEHEVCGCAVVLNMRYVFEHDVLEWSSADDE